MSEDKMICNCKQVRYSDIRKAMIVGARSVEDIQDKTQAGTVCGGCIPEIEEILASVCGCEEVSLKTVLDAVNNGADTVEKVAKQTGAGTGEDCGRCEALIENIIEIRR